MTRTATHVHCEDCNKRGKPEEMAYQGKDGSENTAPGSAFDYYLCQACEGMYKRMEAVEDDESEDSVPCRECGLLFNRNVWECPVCLTTRF